MGIEHLLNKEVEIEITGKIICTGILVDTGTDILVLFDGNEYVYIPIVHLHKIKEFSAKDRQVDFPKFKETLGNNEPISYRKILINGKGKFVKIKLSETITLHGYIVNVLNDYILFYSPIYQVILISMQHVKWLIPYPPLQTPYGLTNKTFPIKPLNNPLARSFEEQLKKYEGDLVVFNMEASSDKAGVLKNIQNNIVEIQNASGEKVFRKLSHLKCVSLALKEPISL
ncbi:hypothetical protein [Heyndrickxia ginsengihumi]|uniref:DUF2642 domain-containing protein n=1 Tax=Heyndrickxia ginsengihumi TaxID=363870 RepID=A0A0A6VF28_9BACI|nr:hypothetical protein [Heyndrickxia ginsengihumi]KHD86840.1 hypothetical protein NG54_00170 [Heyndrickxia ginsengihumi]MBE6183686.1 DUF2642 domain-containing protein [Bacillus sp. (in: firmicutes)]MCM3021836.1 DUF2642 domain-containing protein [Heyndrickxia ginsengihumi]NEY19771.1 DUF2642 domain-containing protein [Heyndrickxia ginsengihumi]